MICGKCGEDKKKYAKGVCNSCYNKHLRPKKECSGCGRIIVIHLIINEYTRYCGNCYKKTYRQDYVAPKKQCKICGNISSMHTKDACLKCYSKCLRPKSNCINCNELKSTAFYGINGEPYCKKCYYKLIYNTPQKECYDCKTINRIAANINNKSYCHSCYNSKYCPKSVCCKCNNLSTINAYINNKPYCKKCYNRPKRECSGCKKNKAISIILDNDKILCHSCHVRHRTLVDGNFNILCRLRARLKYALNKYSKTGKIQKSNKYGINYKSIIDKLGPCPGNRKDYHIDHIIPLCSFDFSNPEEIKKAFAPENHQWLTKEENLKKGKKII